MIGTCQCATGAFTLVRVAALYRKAGEGEGVEKGHNPIERYTREVNSGQEELGKGLGDDRYLTVQIFTNGWKVAYCALAVTETRCPGTFKDKLIQFRRWGLTTIANQIDALNLAPSITSSNTGISWIYFIYFGINFFATFLIPSTVIVWLSGSLSYVFNLDYWTALSLTILPIIIYSIVLYIFSIDFQNDPAARKSRKRDIQIEVSVVLGCLYAIGMAAALVGIFVKIWEDLRKPEYYITYDTYFNTTLNSTVTVEVNVSKPAYKLEDPADIFFLGLTGIFMSAGIIHGIGDFLVVIYGGLSYFFLIPWTQVLAVMFALANVMDVSWGTRETSTNEKEVLLFNYYKLPKKIQGALLYFGFETDDLKAPEEFTSLQNHIGEEVNKQLVFRRELYFFRSIRNLENSIEKLAKKVKEQKAKSEEGRELKDGKSEEDRAVERAASDMYSGAKQTVVREKISLEDIPKVIYHDVQLPKNSSFATSVLHALLPFKDVQYFFTTKATLFDTLADLERKEFLNHLLDNSPFTSLMSEDPTKFAE